MEHADKSSFELVDIPIENESEKSDKELFKFPSRKKRVLDKAQKEKAIKNLEKARKAKMEKLKANALRMQEVQNERKAQVMKMREKSLKHMKKLSKRRKYESESEEDSDSYDSYSESEPEEYSQRYNPGGRPPKGQKVRNPKGMVDEPPVVSGIPLDEYDDIPKKSKKSMKKKIEDEVKSQIRESLSRVVKSKKKKPQPEYSDSEDDSKNLRYTKGFKDVRGGTLSGEEKLGRKIEPNPVVKESLEKTMRIMNPWGCPRMVS